MTEPTHAAIRRPLLTGRQSIAGIWFPAERFPGGERIRLLIAHWGPGCQAHRFDDGDLLQFASPRQLDCNRLEGWPLLGLGVDLEPVIRDIREILGDAVPAASPKRGEMLRALQQRQQDVVRKALAT